MKKLFKASENKRQTSQTYIFCLIDLTCYNLNFQINHFKPG